MNYICEAADAEIEFFQHYLLQMKILTYIPRLVPFDFVPSKFIGNRLSV